MDELFFRFISLSGFVCICLIAWLSGNRFPVNLRTVFGSLFLCWFIGSLIFWIPWSRQALKLLNDILVLIVQASQKGTLFLFGPLALGPGQSLPDGTPSIGFVLALQVLPSVIFFSAFIAGLYYFKIMPALVNFFGRFFYRFMRLSGAESLAASANIFFGIESGLAIRPFLKNMTRSEILTLLTCMMSTVASTVMGIYVLALYKIFPHIAGHLASASLISIPCAVLISKLSLPEHDKPETITAIYSEQPYSPDQPANFMVSLMEGGAQGAKLAISIATLLIVILGLEAVLDLTFGIFHYGDDENLSLGKILEWISWPFVMLLGLKPEEWSAGAKILGSRFVETEVTAYFKLAAIQAEGVFSQRSLTVLTYSLCGFVHIASLGIFIGGLSTIAPSRASDFSILGLRSFWTAFLATLLTGCIAGTLA